MVPPLGVNMFSHDGYGPGTRAQESKTQGAGSPRSTAPEASALGPGPITNVGHHKGIGRHDNSPIGP